jgi:hypothetical protein
VRRLNRLTKTEALKLIETSLLEQAQFTITRAADGALVGTPKKQLRGPPDLAAAMRTYLPDGTVDPPFSEVGVHGAPPRLLVVPRPLPAGSNSGR